MRRGIGLALVSAYGLAVCALIAVCVWKNAQPRPCRATFERVRVGMTREEVEATVGAPPGDYTPSGAFVLRTEDRLAVVGVGIWLTDHADLWVRFDAAGRAQSATVCNVSKLDFLRSRTRWERLWAWVTTGFDNKGGFPVPYPRNETERYDRDDLRRIIQP